MNIVVTVNGPGEAAGWLRPLADAFDRRASGGVSMTAVVTPCQMASGREAPVVAGFPGVARVERLVPYVRRMAMARVRGLADRDVLVLHLGGDPVYALLLARVLRASAWTYGTSARYRGAFRRFLVPDERTATKLRGRAVADERIVVVGQLVTDSVLRGRAPVPAPPDASGGSPTVALLPGSRDAQVAVLVPYYAAVVELVQARLPGVRWRLLASRFVAKDVFASRFGRAGWTMTGAAGTRCAVSPGGLRIELVEGGLEALGTTDLAVTIPGTNTLQLAALGLPHVVIAPGQQSELVAFPGLLGLFDTSWWGARRIRRAALDRLSRRLRYLAIPNIIAGRSIVPELRGHVEPSDVAAQVIALLAAPAARREMSARLKDVAGPSGAAERMVDLMVAWRESACASAS